VLCFNVGSSQQKLYFSINSFYRHQHHHHNIPAATTTTTVAPEYIPTFLSLFPFTVGHSMVPPSSFPFLPESTGCCHNPSDRCDAMSIYLSISYLHIRTYIHFLHILFPVQHTSSLAIVHLYMSQLYIMYMLSLL